LVLVFDIESLAFCDRVVNGDVVPDLVPGVMLLLSFSRDGKETLFGIDDDIIFVCGRGGLTNSQGPTE